MTERRVLGLGSAAALVVASMIGTGVFTTSGFLLRDLGSPRLVLAAWAAGGVLAALGALCYGALARRIPESGGEYLFLSRTLHPAAGFVAGWVSLLAGFSAPLAAAAFAFGAYLQDWLPGWRPEISGSLLLLGAGAVHGSSLRGGAWLQNAAVGVKLLLIAGFLGFALVRGTAGAAPPPPAAGSSAPAFAVALLYVSFSYSGWNAAVYIGGEVRDPERTLPRSLLLATAAVTAAYLGLNAVFLSAAPVERLAGQLEIGRIAARELGGAALAEAVTALIALALVTSASSMTMLGPRVYAQMAQDGFLPRVFAGDPARAGAPPRAAVALQGGLALLMLWTASFEGVLAYIGINLSLCTALAVIGLVRLRRREGAALLPVPGWPWVPAAFLAGVLLILVLSVAQRPRESLAGLLTLVLGLGAWRLWRPRPS